MLHLESATAVATVDPSAGGRLASLSVGGHDLLIGAEVDPMRWGSYPMVPFAGRIRHGRFTFDGVEHALPVNLGPHAIHGYGYTSPWDVVDDRSIRWVFAPPWPFAGEVVQRFELDDEQLRITMVATAHERQPLMLGWHPWLRRDIGVGAAAALDFVAQDMYELDDEDIPTGRLVDPLPGPWDNCFTNVVVGPTIDWGGELRLRLTSSTDHWVVFTEPPHALCVEPQTDAPDAVNRDPTVIDAGQELQIELTMSW